jgi:hypothetical protein
MHAGTPIRIMFSFSFRIQHVLGVSRPWPTCMLGSQCLQFCMRSMVRPGAGVQPCKAVIPPRLDHSGLFKYISVPSTFLVCHICGPCVFFGSVPSGFVIVLDWFQIFSSGGGLPAGGCRPDGGLVWVVDITLAHLPVDSRFTEDTHGWSLGGWSSSSSPGVTHQAMGNDDFDK